MRLIDADLLEPDADYDDGEYWGYSIAQIESAPTIELSAQPEIIHCRDCENWDKTWTNDFSPNYHYCPMVDGVRKDNFYCADAERRTDG